MNQFSRQIAVSSSPLPAISFTQSARRGSHVELEPRIDLLDVLSNATELSFVGRANQAMTGCAKPAGMGIFNLVSGAELGAENKTFLDTSLDRNFMLGVTSGQLRNKHIGIVGVRVGAAAQPELKRVAVSIVPPETIQEGFGQYRSNATGGFFVTIAASTPAKYADAFAAAISSAASPDALAGCMKTLAGVRLKDEIGLIAAKLRDGLLLPLAKQLSTNRFSLSEWDGIDHKERDAACRGFIVCNLSSSEWAKAANQTLRNAGAFA